MDDIKFSVVVAVAPERNPEVIQYLKNQDYPEDRYEIIVKKGANTSQNRNDGVKESKGKYIAFVDDDAIVEKDWLKKAEEFFEKYPEIDLVGGPQLTPMDDTPFGYASGVVLSSILGGASIRNRYRKGKLNLNSDERELSSANIFCKKSVFEDIEFNPAFWPGEDPVFFNELIRKEKKLAYCPELYIYHRRRSTPRSLFIQVFRYGYVRPKIKNVKKTGIYSYLFIIPSLFVLYLVLLPFLSIVNIFFLIPASIYFLTIIIFSCFIAVQNKNIKYLLLIPAIFFIIHTGYGIGFLCGAIESLNRNNFIRKIELHIRLLFPHYQHREKNLLLSIIQGRGLDIGCGAEKVSPSCIGIDIIAPGEKGRFGSQKGKISVADYVISGDNLHIFKDEEFDFIVAKHNLEHYSHPDKTLMEWKRVLKKGGKIGVIVPDDRYVDSTGLDPTHKVSFTLENLEELFKNKGFIILASGVAIKHWSIYLIAKKPEI